MNFYAVCSTKDISYIKLLRWFFFLFLENWNSKYAQSSITTDSSTTNGYFENFRSLVNVHICTRSIFYIIAFATVLNNEINQIEITKVSENCVLNISLLSCCFEIEYYWFSLQIV